MEKKTSPRLHDSLEYEHFDTVANTEIATELLSRSGGAAQSLDAQTSDFESDQPESNLLLRPGFFACLEPLNRTAKEGFQRLSLVRNDPTFEYHCKFMHIESGQNEIVAGSYVLSLQNLPQYAALGWRIGRGRKDKPNLGVDILMLVGDDDKSVAGVHARIAWIKGGGGLFLIADNLRGQETTLNGERLVREQRLIPFRNAISVGDWLFSVRFAERNPEQEERFQLELASFYSVVLSESTPLLSPTPSGREVLIGGEWLMGDPIAKGAFGHVYLVTNTVTGKHAAAKEIWKTVHNARSVDQEVRMAELLSKMDNVSVSMS
jgi:hypothetical protein